MESKIKASEIISEAGFTTLAPVAIFAFNRTDHLRRCLSALSKNHLASETDLYIFCDGTRDNHDVNDVASVRDFAKTVQGFGSTTVLEQPTNRGLANSIIEGVSKLCELKGRVIVVEDDLVTSPWFLTFMNEGLTKYEKSCSVLSLGGYLPPIEFDQRDCPALLPMPTSWGWATWADRWALFEPDGSKLLKTLKNEGKLEEFDALGAYSCVKMLKDQIAEKNNSWYIRWLATACLNEMSSVYPPVSLIKNCGFDGTGVHCNQWVFDPFDGPVSKSRIVFDDSTLLQTGDENLVPMRRFYRRVRQLRYANFVARLYFKIRDGVLDATLTRRRGN